jgi:hypothetical protein
VTDRLSREFAGAVKGRGARRWPAAIALLALGISYFFVPEFLRVGPPWLLLAVSVVLLIPLFLAHSRGYHLIALWLGRVAVLLVTLAVALSAIFLLTRLPGGKIPGSTLLRDAGFVWFANIVAFALCYWEIDAGGPSVRCLGQYVSTDFLFPQFQQDPEKATATWMPELIDYLFLAFNTSTAFSPTDTPVLSRRAKVLQMCQSLISLVVVAVLAGRAINTL